MSERIETIRRMIAEQGEEPFLVYSLGMELASAGDHAAAVEQFRRCMELDEGYLPAYGEAGKSLRAAGRIEEAREAFNAGIALAAEQGESHVRDSLRQQLEGLGAG